MVQDRVVKTPLFLFINTANLDDIVLLLKHGADPDVKEYTKGLSSRTVTGVSFLAVAKLFYNRAMMEKVVKER